LEKDFQIQLANEKAKLCNLDDNRAVEEQHNMTMRLLKEITSEKDEVTVLLTQQYFPIYFELHYLEV